MSAKFSVSELAKMMGKPAKEVLFLLQGIGVDVKSVESILDPGTAQAILTGKTQAPKTLIVRQSPSAAVAATVAAKVKTERAALKRIKIVEKAAEPELETPVAAGEEPVPAPEPIPALEETAAAAPLRSPLPPRRPSPPRRRSRRRAS